jgi:haloalkane dehalogenase
MPDQDQVQENKEAWQELKKFNKPTITLFGDHDKAFLGQEKFFIDKIPGAKDMPHCIISAGHFSQEDQPELLSEALLSIN